MPEFIMDTSGEVIIPGTAWVPPVRWAFKRDLDNFTQGYLEAMFFTETATSFTSEDFARRAALLAASPAANLVDIEGTIPCDASFGDLSPGTLLAAILDCTAFQATEAYQEVIHGGIMGDTEGETNAGRDFWFTRTGHGCGFWDGNWAEPHGTHLTAAAKAFREVDVYWGDDERVHT